MSVAVGLALAQLDASAPNFELRAAIADPATLALITVLMMLVAAAATYFPVRRAATGIRSRPYDTTKQESGNDASSLAQP
jgi:hypothetical protein